MCRSIARGDCAYCLQTLSADSKSSDVQGTVPPFLSLVKSGMLGKAKIGGQSLVGLTFFCCIFLIFNLKKHKLVLRRNGQKLPDLC
jgi:hypothetical protein